MRIVNNDNPGTRYFMPGILKKLSAEEVNEKYDRSGYRDSDIDKWFNRNANKYENEFGWRLKKFEE